ncbi:hypothetical protein [Bacillus sp. Marseille-Q3570]|uniref:hypothetical protein n=1 Tax=Bacillus sp. Marseille-Q3570 TaxID=2963522 RepID=UPI0021B7ECA3|nr:hypothetical protein [Bacillus sp. Marseille-Q3570]
MKQLLAGIGDFGLCILCCTFPGLFVGFAGMVGIGFGMWKWGVILIVFAVILSLIVKKNKKQCSKKEECSCGGGVYE